MNAFKPTLAEGLVCVTLGASLVRADGWAWAGFAVAVCVLIHERWSGTLRRAYVESVHALADAQRTLTAFREATESRLADVEQAAKVAKDLATHADNRAGFRR